MSNKVCSGGLNRRNKDEKRSVANLIPITTMNCDNSTDCSDGNDHFMLGTTDSPRFIVCVLHPVIGFFGTFSKQLTFAALLFFFHRVNTNLRCWMFFLRTTNGFLVAPGFLRVFISYYLVNNQDGNVISNLLLNIKIEVFIYFLCFVIGGPLNVISLRRSLSVLSKHKANSPILLLRINLNLADLCTLFVYVPKQIIWMITYQWYGGELLCRACSFFSTFSFYANSFVITCIAIDRVCGAYNMSSVNAHQRAYFRCRRLLIVGWVAAFLLSLPQAIIFRVFKPYHNKDFKQCTPLWTTFLYEQFERLNDINLPDVEKARIEQSVLDMQRMEKMYNINHLLFVFWIPCVIIVISYLTVLLILQGHLKDEYHGIPVVSTDDQIDNNSSKFTPKGKSPNLNGRTGQSAVVRNTNTGTIAVSTIHKAKQHAKRQAAWIILAYLTFWSPYNVLAVLNMTRTLSDHHLFVVTLSFLNAAICANPIANPLIYGVLKSSGK
ncbi:7 transmembrane receptor [Dictyocaulus viviparus]|uniref:7 transmembrane receptor n=1 Tax=Dictyocaulus viviparus TaxID=29172 RepID=A0A0D8XEY3_DICVI|nr:7 transmembrane receptor [Dictyocaulus viviparus]